ncbi:hypothetical protein [uncultured Bacteroides sp.]|uniref:hypothetical protein n=1 Tax=uncultured Bacteroides sp. TaxID=162156 RepID=UPI00261D21E4|nr:hypothetical protein [uncultured Bacteroides sp.]
MNKQWMKCLLMSASLVFGVIGLNSCVDKDYDLSKDVDMTITVGGDLTIPGSNTDEITLEKIFDLDENSSVQANANGDYVLTQTGPSNETSVTIDPVTVGSEEFEMHSIRYFEYHFDYNPALLVGHEDLVTDEGYLPIQKDMVIEDSVYIDKGDITQDLIDLKMVKVSMDVTFSLDYTGSAWWVFLKKGFVMHLPDYMTVTCDDPRITVDGSNMIFKEDTQVKAGESLEVVGHVTHLDFDKLKAKGQGLVERGHFVLEDVYKSYGQVYVVVKDLDKTFTIDALIKSEIQHSDMVLLEAQAVVDPDIDIQVDPMDVTDIPDFLDDDEVTVNLEDPRMFLNVTNPTPVDINLTGTITPIKDGKELTDKAVTVGSDTEGPGQIIIPANTENYVVCIHRKTDPTGITANSVVTVPDLNNVIETIPDRIKMEPVDASAVQKFFDITLDRTYTVNTDYHFESLLQFNEGTKVVYSDDLDGWAGDMADYDVKEAIVTLNANNTIPMNMNMVVDVVDASGNLMTDVTATVEGDIALGTPESPTDSQLKITLKSSREGALRNMDGIRYRVVASATEASAGTVLNKDQRLVLSDISIKLVGGITIDMN